MAYEPECTTGHCQRTSHLVDRNIIIEVYTDKLLTISYMFNCMSKCTMPLCLLNDGWMDGWDRSIDCQIPHYSGHRCTQQYSLSSNRYSLEQCSPVLPTPKVYGYVHIDTSTSTSSKSGFQFTARTSFTRTSERSYSLVQGQLNACLPTISS